MGKRGRKKKPRRHYTRNKERQKEKRRRYMRIYMRGYRKGEKGGAPLITELHTKLQYPQLFEKKRKPRFV